MEKIKVIEENRYRDGGTIVYIDQLNRLYYMWSPTKKIYNQMTNNGEPKPWIREIPVDLDIVKSF